MTPSTPAVVRGQEWRACTLALIAGYADAYGFFHYQAYMSFMSGNTTTRCYRQQRGASRASRRGRLIAEDQ